MYSASNPSQKGTSQQGDRKQEQPKMTSVEEARRILDEVTSVDDKGHRVMKPKEWWKLVVFPLPEVVDKKANGYSTSGKEMEVTVNAYPIRKVPKNPIFLYEVSNTQLCPVPSAGRSTKLSIGSGDRRHPGQGGQEAIANS